MHVPAWPVLPDQTIAPTTSEAFRVPALAGLGNLICDEYGECYDDGEGTGAGGSPAGTGSGIDWGNFLGEGLKAGTQLAKLVLVQPGTVQQGTILIRQTPGYSVPTPVTSTGLKVQTSTGDGFLIAAAVGLAALVFLLRKG